MGDWKETRLWACLKESDAAITIQECMPQIQTVLHSASTMPIDFTLHDADHSFRVAERAADLLPSKINERIGKFDAALLLLASYLHDIGMSPSKDLTKRHRSFIVSGENSMLTDVEQSEFQQWLDENWQGLVPPLSMDETSEHGISKVEEILAYYCRHKHNDWSEKWIRENLVDLRSSLYHGWLDDLITLCRSHHEGLAALRTDRFDVRVVGASGEVINLRYLAALLRLADVLEFDPERTPSVIMRHRDIAPKSKIYWRKDQAINFNVVAAEQALILAARTPDAGVHRAVLDTIDSVNVELNTCAVLFHEGLFQKGTAPIAEKQRYLWPWPSQLRVDIKEKDNSFVYIEGGFRPDKVKILELLSGTNLYGDHWAAVRELLQNATDAVREQIARERLRKENPNDSRWQAILGETHKIRISLETDGSSYFLSCIDDGVGMDRNVIENHLLVSGSRSRGDLVALDRDSKKHGFSVGSTGQFGIGLLSYFMVADDISISTRRSAEAGDFDGTGWRFSIEGLNSFGELRPESRGTNGTSVKLRLKSEVLSEGIVDFGRQLAQYIRETFRYSPCSVTYHDYVSGEVFISPKGWTGSDSDCAKRIAIDKPGGYYGHLRPLKKEFLPFKELKESLDIGTQWSGVEEDFERRKSLFGPLEEYVAEVDGLIRGWVGFQELQAGASLAYLTVEDGFVKKVLKRQEFAKISGSANISWRGFSANGGFGDFRKLSSRSTFVEINCTSNGKISVDRTGVNFNRDISKIMEGFESRILRKFLDDNYKSDFSLMNCHFAKGFSLLFPTEVCRWKPFWPMFEKEGKQLTSIKFPCMDILLPKFDEFPTIYDYVLNGKKYNVLAHIQGEDANTLKISGLLSSGKLAFRKIAGEYSGATYVPVLTWESEQELCGTEARPYACSFPDDWKSIALVHTAERPIYNLDHDLVTSDRSIKLNSPGHSISEIVDVIKKTKERNIFREIILLNLNRGERFWNGFRDNFPEDFLTFIRRAELPDGCIRAWHFKGSYDENRTILLNENGAAEVIQYKQGAHNYHLLHFSDGINFEFRTRELSVGE